MRRHFVYHLTAVIFLLAAADLCRAEEDILRSSLLELKNSMQQMIDVNHDLSSRNVRFRDRILELQRQLQEIKDQKQMLLDEKRNLVGASAGEMDDVDSLRRTISDLESQLNRFSREYASLQRKLGGKDEEQKRYQSRQEKLNQEISQLRDKRQAAKPVFGISNDKKMLRDNIESVRRKVQLRKEDLQREQAKSRIPLAELENIREKRRQQTEKLDRLSKEWQTISNDQERLREKISQRESQQADDIGSLRSAVEALLVREQELKNDQSELIAFKKQMVDGFADQKKDLNNTLDISLRSNRELKEQIAFLEGSLKQMEQFSSAQVAPASGQEQEEALKKQGDDLRLQHIYIQNQIAEKKKEVDGAARQAAQAQADLQAMSDDLTVSRKSTIKILEQEKAKYQKWLKRKPESVPVQKNIPYGEEEKQLHSQKAAAFQAKITALRQELRDLDLERSELRQKQLAGQQEGQGALENLNAEIKSLEEIEEEMAFLLADVDKKYKANRVDVRELRQDERQLSEHLSVLQEENQHLQSEVLSLGVALDKTRMKPR